MNIDDWLKQVEPNYLTIQYIQDMKLGETQKFLCIDRNFYELIPELTQENAIDVELFFQKCYILDYTHSINLTGLARFNIENINKPKTYFEFDIEYLKNRWYPLKNGKLPIKDPQGIFSELERTDVKRNWEEYDKSTRIGWRGPMIPWNIISINDWPKIYNC